jgi:peroxiredoxin
VFEAKVGRVTTHDAIIYRHKAAIDREGIVRHVFSAQRGVEKHVDEALKALRSLN